MPKSRQRKKSSVQKGRNTHSKADIMRINGAYQKKYEHYSTYELEQLEALVASKTEKGTYLHALLQVIEAKKRPVKINASDILSSGPSVDSIEAPVAPQIEETAKEST